MVKICINCNAENLEEALFCKKCGSKLPTLRDIENERREKQEEADRKWKEEVAKTKQRNEALNETRRNEGSVAVYGSGKRSSNLPQTRESTPHSAHHNNYSPPARRPRPHHKEQEKKSQMNSTTLIIINLSVILLIAVGVLGYFYISKDGISINNTLQELESDKSTPQEEVYGTFIDSDKKLMWQDDLDSKKQILTWNEATEYCDNLFLGENTDWRLPRKDELVNIIERSEIKNISKTAYWANKIKYGSSFAWYVSFSKGGGADYEDIENLNSVRCVRNY